MTMITPSYLGETIEYSSLHACRSTLEDPTAHMTPEQFEAFEDARSETARLGWEPFMHNPSLPYLLRGLKIPTLLVWGTRDRIVPRGCIDAYRAAIKDARIALVEGAGHRPEIENPAEFDRLVREFLAA